MTNPPAGPAVSASSVKTVRDNIASAYWSATGPTGTVVVNRTAVVAALDDLLTEAGQPSSTAQPEAPAPKPEATAQGECGVTKDGFTPEMWNPEVPKHTPSPDAPGSAVTESYLRQPSKRAIALLEEAMHALLYVDAHMSERIEVAEKIARAIRHPWPPYEDDEDERSGGATEP